MHFIDTSWNETSRITRTLKSHLTTIAQQQLRRRSNVWELSQEIPLVHMQMLWHSRDSKLVQIQYTCIFSAPSHMHHHHNPPKPLATKILRAIGAANGCIFGLRYGREIRKVGACGGEDGLLRRKFSLALHNQCCPPSVPVPFLRAPVLSTVNCRSVSPRPSAVRRQCPFRFSVY